MQLAFFKLFVCCCVHVSLDNYSGYFLLIFVPIRDGIHYFVYCFNMLHQRIDVLDSNDYFLNYIDKLDRHEAVFAKIPIIDAAF